MDDTICQHCHGLKEIRNPTGSCDHLYWPELLTDEAKHANGYHPVTRVVTTWERQTKDLQQPNS